MITDLSQIDALGTRVLKEGGVLRLQVTSGPSVLSERVFTNTMQATPAEVDLILRDMTNDVVLGEAPRLNDAGGLVDMRGEPIGAIYITGDVGIGKPLVANLRPNWSATSFKWFADGVEIPGAISNTFYPTDSQQGKTITAQAVGLAFNDTATGIVPPITTPRPGFMQASPLGFSAAVRTVTGHTSALSYRSACDTNEVELTVSNVTLFGGPSISESIPSDGKDLIARVSLFRPTFPYVPTSRNFATAPLAGATSATLASPFNQTSTRDIVYFSNGEIRFVYFKNGSTAVTWTTPLSSDCTTTAFTRAWTRIDVLPNDILLAGGTKSTQQLRVAVPNLKRDDVVLASCHIRAADGSSFVLPAQQPVNHLDYLANGLQESFVDSSTDQHTTRLGAGAFLNFSGGSSAFKPLGLRAVNPTNMLKRPTYVIGDSIGSSMISWVQQFLHANKVPYVNMSKAGETASKFINNNQARILLADKGIALCQLGRNSWNLASAQLLWAWCRAQGFSTILQVLPPPITTGTSGGTSWQSESTQNEDLATQAVNAQIIAMLNTAGGPNGIIDTYTPVKGTNPNKWAPNLTDDGIHPNAAGTTLILAYFASQGYAAMFNF